MTNEARSPLQLAPLLGSLDRVEPLAASAAHLGAGGRATIGVLDAAKTTVAAWLWRRLRTPTLLIVPRETDADAALDALRVWAGDAAVPFPARTGLPYAREDPPTDVTRGRLEVLAHLARGSGGPPPLIVASTAAVTGFTARPADLGAGPARVAVGDRVTIEVLAARLVAAGYDVGPLVEQPGQAARRGGLVDVFPPTEPTPVRIELFGDEVESIRRFDAETQRTVEMVEDVHIGPASEWFPSREALSELAGHLEPARRRALDDLAAEELAALRRGELPAPARYGPLAAEATLLDHLGPHALVIVDEPDAVHATAAEQDALAAERRDQLVAVGDLGPAAPLPHLEEQALIRALDQRAPRADLERWATGRERDGYRVPFAPHDAYAGRLQAAARELVRSVPRGDRIVVLTQQAQRFGELLAEAGLDSSVLEHLDAPPAGASLSLVQGSLPGGWRIETPEGRVALATDAELMGFVRKRRALRQSASHRAQFLAEVSPGDFVVHSEHGIARFAGIVRRAVGDEQRDYLQLNYAGDDRLYVPIEQIDRVTRYIASSGHIPRLTRLGTQEWARTRARVRAAVGDVAADLLRLYAARQLLRGHAFGLDTEWQREMEAAFPYEETEDQLAAITAVKEDMEAVRPMDRIVLGDVGFGKTEVAVRAAFKAVQDGYQVALLVPTTVLAQQHERTFRERLAPFPVRIEALSRFRTDAEAREVGAGLRSGEIDIVIGTHRLLQPGIEFGNLGLVVIDEEQRFGVAHKERLKRMRLEVDVLTLSATPIPRTLHMSLAGIRDMSPMDTAPEDRLPVQTFVAEWDDALVRDAILHEQERGGQVYLVHNRVETIDRVAEQVRALAPEARVIVGHGQMPKAVLRRVMERFSAGEADVLVCTTIIESGIDIPNVNTLIIDRAELLGMAQLYQLRGRVGRGAQQAHAYLLHRRDRVLTEVQQQRLATIFEATELGAGFQVALRDLEIRGAGNLLGAEQSGQIASVGFDLYTQMLAEAVAEQRAAHDGEPAAAPPPPVSVDLPVTAYIPEPYMEDIEARVALYQRIAGLRSVDAAAELRAEIEDRFGAPPPPLEQLLALVRIRLAAGEARVAAVRIEGDVVVIGAVDDSPFSRRRLPALPPAIEVGRTQLRVTRDRLGEDWLQSIELLLRLLATSPPSDAAVREPAAAGGRV
ncbi:MAG: transcription-repair coupling factor [Chloroflexi bacterium]|nr:transcription-repair coupling factor [Chloroflexota bacterium]